MRLLRYGALGLPTMSVNALVLQVDHEHVIEFSDRRHRRRGWRWGGQGSADSERKVVGVGVVVVAGSRVAVRQGHDHMRAAGAYRNRPRGARWMQLGLKNPRSKQSDRLELAAAQPQLFSSRKSTVTEAAGGVQL